MYSRNQVDKAGQTLCTSNSNSIDYRDAIDILNNWRSSHSYPINTFQATLRSKTKKIDENAIVAQRLKRTPSIINKLQRFEGMKLSRMQDIGGLRAVVRTLDKANALEKSYKDSHFRHTLIKEKNYISAPKDSGYRSIHMIYRYHNNFAPEYDGLLLELQIRTQLQHAWATAVETMGIFLNYALKSSEGPEEWLDFFSLTGSAFALLEGCSPVPNYAELSKQQTFQKVMIDTEKLDVKSKLEAFAVAAKAITTDRHTGSSYHLIILYPEEKKVVIKIYGRRRLDQANLDYTQEELRISKGENIQVALVSAGPLNVLRRAYPNFFLDTGAYIKYLNRIEKIVKQEEE